jgi:hypothetical protein
MAKKMIKHLGLPRKKRFLRHEIFSANKRKVLGNWGSAPHPKT